MILMADVMSYPDHRRQGFITIFLEHLVEFTREKQVMRITMLTVCSSDESQAFSHKLGFEHSPMISMRQIIGDQ